MNPILDGIYKSKEELLNESLEMMIKIQHEDRLALFAILEMLINYINGYEFSEETLKKQKIIMNDISNRYDIHSMEDLRARTDEAVLGLRLGHLAKMEPLGGVQ